MGGGKLEKSRTPCRDTFVKRPCVYPDCAFVPRLGWNRSPGSDGSAPLPRCPLAAALTGERRAGEQSGGALPIPKPLSVVPSRCACVEPPAGMSRKQAARARPGGPKKARRSRHPTGGTALKPSEGGGGLARQLRALGLKLREVPGDGWVPEEWGLRGCLSRLRRVCAPQGSGRSPRILG